MAYDDGYYYGQCKLVAVVDDAADNDKTVLITTDDNKTYSGTIANKKCEFLLPPRTLYTVQKVLGESVEFTTKVEAGYGDCILVHLDTGYVEVKQGDIVGLDYIKAATDDNLKNKVPEAKAVKELNSSLGGLQFGVDKDGNYGYIKAGAATVVPFKTGINIVYLGGAGTYDCSGYKGYKKFTNDNFFCKSVSASFSFHISDTSNCGGGSGSCSGYKVSYNSSTGIVVCSNSNISGNADGTKLPWNMSIALSYYLIY